MRCPRIELGCFCEHDDEHSNPTTWNILTSSTTVSEVAECIYPDSSALADQEPPLANTCNVLRVSFQFVPMYEEFGRNILQYTGY
jgi:hypothetical protein